MKKPKISPGSWDVNGDGIVYCFGLGPETKEYRPCIAKVSRWRGEADVNLRQEGIANSIAMRAVPEMIDELIKAHRDLNLWILTYASEHCDAEDVKKARKEISDGGGTLAYIGDRLQEIEQALEKAGAEL